MPRPAGRTFTNYPTGFVIGISANYNGRVDTGKVVYDVHPEGCELCATFLKLFQVTDDRGAAPC